ncbi:MAG: phosphotransferase family protein [Bacteroidota bacterium]
MQTDPTIEVRSRSQLDIAALQAYLEQHPDSPDALEISQVRQFPGGFSNLTYLVVINGKEYVLRRPPHGIPVGSRAHDMGREFRVLTQVQTSFNDLATQEASNPNNREPSVSAPVPRPWIYCEDAQVLGAPFYLMERVEGITLRPGFPQLDLLTPSTMEALSQASIDLLLQLHRLDVSSPGMQALGKPEGYNQRQVTGWIKRYRASQTDAIPQLEAIIDWLPNNLADSGRVALIHNDYKYDNLLLNPKQLTQIKAILDWEMATLGDPLMDLGTSLAYWAEAGDPEALKPFNFTWLPGNWNRQQVVDYYGQQSGMDLGNIQFYYLFGLFKVAVICQQIYARYKKGLTQDERFGMLIYVIKAAAENGVRSLEQGKISGLY